MKKEIKDEITHILYDQTRRTPIVIPVINEIGGGGGGQQNQQQGGRRPVNAGNRPQQAQQPQSAPAAVDNPQARPFKRPAPKQLPPKQVPDTEATQPKPHFDTRGY